jgi:hypothetical protein
VDASGKELHLAESVSSKWMSGDADEMDLDLSKFCLSGKKYLLLARLI